MTATFAAGSIVRARGRSWVVQPESNPPLYILHPLGGESAEKFTLHADLEPLSPELFGRPSAEGRGDASACRRMRDAARLATRHAAGPYRSFARLGFDPRPYQLVPLMLALRLETVRILIADDVGIGKTIESLMIARELYDRCEIRGFSILCPPHLTLQWQRELLEKFHLEAELVLASTTQRLERTLRSTSETIFSRYPITIVSLDYVKSERRRREFVQSCPPLVIVDEAHACTGGGSQKGRVARQQRHEVLRLLSEKPEQHIILTTATPHSGDPGAYANLLGLLDSRFGASGDLHPESADQDARVKALSRHFVQRRRKDIEKFLGDTRFPEREAFDVQYSLSAPMRRAVAQVADFMEGYLSQSGAGQNVQRTRRWAMLSLLQAFASSPRAAQSTLARRSGAEFSAETTETESAGIELLETELQGQCSDDFEDSGEAFDVEISVSQVESQLARSGSRPGHTREAQEFFQRLFDEIANLGAADDLKLQALAKFLSVHVKARSGTVVFCRFIATAEYLREELANRLGSKAAVECVIGSLPDDERSARIERLVEESESQQVARVLVCTDCLSEGINLQHSFDTVIHYDLSWNPNRHVQREGRVDRFGQPSAKVQIRQFFSEDTLFDAAVLENNRAKRERISRELGYYIHIPISRDALLDDILDIARKRRPVARTGNLFTSLEAATEQQVVERETEAMLDYERRTRSRFSQHQLDPTAVEGEWKRIKEAIGYDDVQRFVLDALKVCGVTVEPRGSHYRVVLEPDSRPEVRDFVQQHLKDRHGERRIVFRDATSERPTLLVRTHPFVEALATYVLQSTLDPLLASASSTLPLAARCGIVQTSDVTQRTMVVLLRHRFELRSPRRTGTSSTPLLAEDVHSVAWHYDVGTLERASADVAHRLVQTASSGNLEGDRGKRALEAAMKAFDAHGQRELEAIALERAEHLATAHASARAHARARDEVRPVGDPDILALYVYLPTPVGGVA
jgi:superfamily II DNA or RNA helicase